MEITTTSQFEQFVMEYGFRFHNCQQFTVNDLAMYLPNENKTKLQYLLEDLAIKGTVKRNGSTFFYVPDTRTLNEKVMGMFGNQFVFFTLEQISNTLRQRPDYVKPVIDELVNEGKLVQCPFIGGAFWLAE